jgi:CRP/FNR family transcriptional regulator, cyclic AMP receptor protein
MVAPPSIDKRQALSGHFLFRQLRDAELTALLAHARTEHRKANEVIFHKDSPGFGLMAVLSGRVKITSAGADGKEVVLNIIDPGEVFGEVALLDGKPRTADAVAISPTELLVIDRRDFVPFLESNPRVAIRLLEVLCERLRRTSEQLQDVLFLDLRARLAKTLLRLAKTHGQATAGGHRIDLRLSQSEIGNMTGLTRESINKQLRDWQKRKLIDWDRGTITIRDIPALTNEGEALG